MEYTCADDEFRNVLFVVILTVVLCQVFTNLGATIVLSQLLNSEILYFANASVRLQNLRWAAVIYAANVGGFVTLLGALAGILWQSFVEKETENGNGTPISYSDFLKHTIWFAPPIIFCGTFAVWFGVDV